VEARERMGRLSEVHQHAVEHEIEHGGGHGGHAAQPLFNRWIGVLVAAITLLAGVMTLLQNDASVRAATYRRDGQQLAIQAMGEKTAGQAQVNYALSNLHTVAELNVQAASADKQGDNTAAQAYTALATRISALTPLATAPYSGDLTLYESEVYLVKTTDEQEHAAANQELNEFWEGKSHTYILLLTLLAVSLALFGLATTVTQLGRTILIGVGAALVVVLVVWMVGLYLQPAPNRPDAAIAAYARGVGLANQGKDDQALAAFEEAIKQAPEYPNAQFQRGNENLALKKYDAALEAYNEAVKGGLDTANVAWNAGWAAYLLGDFEKAVQINRHALALNSALVPVHYDLALSLLAAGQIDEARQEYKATMDTATQQVAAAHNGGPALTDSFFDDLDGGQQDLDNLVDLLAGHAHSWAQVPPSKAIAKPTDVAAAAQSLAQQLAELSVALELTSAPPAAAAGAQIKAFQFAVTAADQVTTTTDFAPDFNNPDQTAAPVVGLDSGTYTVGTSFPADTDRVEVFFDYAGVRPGADVLWKVTVDGTEDPTLRRRETWGLGAAGTAVKPISLSLADPGDYTVALYIDSRRVQTGTFTLEAP